MRPLFLDFETYFDSKAKYGLKELSYLEYIKSPKFKVFGVGLKDDSGPAHWISGDHNVRMALNNIDWANTAMIAHNAKFDASILAWVYGHVPRAIICTQAMSRAVLGYTVPGHSLATLADYFHLPAKGHLQTDGYETLTPEQDRELGEYCIHDVELDADIFERLGPDFPLSQWAPMDWTIRRFILPQLRLDGAKLKTIHAGEKIRREKIFEEIGIPKKTFASNALFPKLLQERGFEIPMKPSPTAAKKGETKMIPALALGDAAFVEMVNSENEELADLCEARVAAKSTQLETRSEKFLRLVDLGPWPFDVQFSGAQQTHRYSGSNGAGGNPQNLPMRNPRTRVLREAVTAPEGHALIVADFAGIELRISSWLARELRLIQPIIEGRDIYSEFASDIYGRTITKSDGIQRALGKEAVLGLGYGMGAEKFRTRVKLQAKVALADEEARRIVDLYRTKYKGVPNLWVSLDNVIAYMERGTTMTVPGVPFLRVSGPTITLPSGLKLKYMNLRPAAKRGYEYDGYRAKTKAIQVNKLYGGALLENICQALAGDICKIAIQRAEQAGVVCVGQVHDEILAIYPAQEAEKGAALLRRAMEQPIPWWPELRLKAEVGTGQNWLEAKKGAK